MDEIEPILRRAETEGERLAAWLRVIIVVAFFAVVLALPGGADLKGPMILTACIYAAGTVVGLMLARRRLFHPTVPYLFVTFDVALLVAQLLMLSRAMGMGHLSVFALPTASLVFIVIIHAAMRFRPWLVVYTAVVFLVAMAVGTSLIAAGGPFHPATMTSVGGGAGMTEMLFFTALPVTVIALCTLMLFLTGRRTRRLLLESIQEGRRAARLARYFSPNLARDLAATPEAELMAGRRQTAIVLFADIQGFTGLTERMTPAEICAFLTAFRSRVAHPIYEAGGTIDKFIGDAVMVVFGTPEARPDDAARALAAALNMLKAVDAWSAERRDAGQPAVAIGIGIHSGEVFAGALGDGRLLEYTVIGHAVNVAERLERRTRDVGSPLVVSEALLNAAGASASAASWRRLPDQPLRGQREPVAAYALIRGGGSDDLDQHQGNGGGSGDDEQGHHRL
ncbi:MAG: adenylate/guanylate cyclase domain-containing protein [Inquilinaceae bacterium]